MSRPRSCCRCSRRAISPSSWCFWSRDPDGSQHNQGDSLGKVTPGINGPTSLAAIKNADDDLAQLRATLDQLGLSATTDIVISADHGFATISKESKTSAAAQAHYDDVPAGMLPPGFLGARHRRRRRRDGARFDGQRQADRRRRRSPEGGKRDHRQESRRIPIYVVAANGGSDLVYVPSGNRRTRRACRRDAAQRGLCQRPFVDDRFGHIAGTLPLSAIG